ncbi:MAG TPA: hypothetical protein VGG72_07525 [Bryobacteraceae bacterium]|jgi:predicted transcriptional regulator
MRTTPAVSQEQILLALLIHPTQEKVAAVLGISTATVRRHLKNPEFTEKLVAERQEAISLALGRFLPAVTAAIAQMLEIMRDETLSNALRIRAVKCYIKHARKLLERDSLEARVDSLKDPADVLAAERRAATDRSGGGAPTQSKSAIKADKTQRLIAALFSYGSKQQAAGALGISTTTVWRWMKEPAFVMQYASAKREAFSRVVGLVLQSINTPVTVLMSIFLKKGSTAPCRLMAADLVAEYAPWNEGVQAEINRVKASREKQAA